MTSKEIVGPVRTSRRRDGTVLTVDIPRDTCDPRYMLCHGQHRTGCDCWEAERSEELNEYRAMWQEARDVARQVCAGHPTWPDYYVEERRGVFEVTYAPVADCCQCTGCQIIRKAYL